MHFFRLWVVAASLFAATVAFAQSTVDYEDWSQLATSVETTLSETEPSDSYLVNVREAVVRWRQQFFDQQDVNANRITTLREQIATLGPVPEDGVQEAPEITARRTDLEAQLTQAEAPRLRANEALRRADGIIQEIDAVLGARDRAALVERYTSPLNPSMFAEAASWVTASLSETWRGVVAASQADANKEQARDNLPFILVMTLAGLALVLRGRSIATRFLGRVVTDERIQSPGLIGLFVSLWQVILPVAGVFALAYAWRLSGFYGARGEAILDILPQLGIYFFTARWIAGRLMPAEPNMPVLLPVDENGRAQGRFWATVLAGTLIGSTFFIELGLVEGVRIELTAAVDFPFVLVGAIGLFFLGRLMSRPIVEEPQSEEDVVRRPFELVSLLPVIGKAAQFAAIVGTVLAVLGYYAATEFAIFSVIQTLAILGLVLIAHQAVRDIATKLVAGDASQALWPVLVNFAISLFALPFIALEWGATREDLSDLWRAFNEGLTLGETQISPTTFLTLLIVFVIGMIFTRVVQSAFRNSILPRTRIEKGGQVAIVSGLGYVGIFIAALVAISSAGLNLSSLAIVAGALSVGIGFGLQNIVSNFVSGIILLIERPISEGDWIEVGANMGIVKDISVRSTRIETFDRTDVIVPNADLVSGTVTNYTRGNTVGRIIVGVGVAYGNDTRHVENVLRDIAEAHPLILMNPKPGIVFVGFGADSIDFEIRAILRDIGNGIAVKNELHHQIVERFASEGIEIPFVQRDIWIRNPEAITSPEKAS